MYSILDFREMPMFTHLISLLDSKLDLQLDAGRVVVLTPHGVPIRCVLIDSLLQLQQVVEECTTKKYKALVVCRAIQPSGPYASTVPLMFVPIYLCIVVCAQAWLEGQPRSELAQLHNEALDHFRRALDLVTYAPMYVRSSTM